MIRPYQKNVNSSLSSLPEGRNAATVVDRGRKTRFRALQDGQRLCIEEKSLKSLKILLSAGRI